MRSPKGWRWPLRASATRAAVRARSVAGCAPDLPLSFSARISTFALRRDVGLETVDLYAVGLSRLDRQEVIMRVGQVVTFRP